MICSVDEQEADLGLLVIHRPIIPLCIIQAVLLWAFPVPCSLLGRLPCLWLRLGALRLLIFLASLVLHLSLLLTLPNSHTH